MQVIQESKARLLCTVCGREINITLLKDSVYSFRTEGKKYPVYEYECPYCNNKSHISQKFLDDLNRD